MNTTIASPLAKPVTEDQYTLLHSIFLHLFPGVLITLFYLLAVHPVMAAGFPPMAAMLLAILFVAIPVELGDLYRRGRARNGRLSLEGVVTYRRPMPAWQLVVFTLAFLALALLITGAAGLVDNGVVGFLSRWLPAWYFMQNTETYAAYSKTALQWTLVFNLLLNGLAAPVVEELYFRGMLLPRLARCGAWAPLISAALFSIYHFWQPYNYLSILAVYIPLTYLVWRKQNVGLGIATHMAMNILGNLLLFGRILGG